MSVNIEIIEFIRSEIIEAEQALKAREDMERTWREGSDQAWAAAATIHSSTRGRIYSKEERLKESQVQGRIAAKCRQRLAMLTAVLKELQLREL